ncbi:MAG: TonB-dependent receptor [Hellea sp.]|nr:TonB-dependent receptor [Hellea sp.]
MPISSPKSAHIKSVRSLLLAGASLSILSVSQVALAQGADPTAVSEDEIVVLGTRQVIQDSIALKRGNTQIVDGLSADEIGDIPALSIGEALETITGVASHRENGGATEVSVRGLGPYLSSTVVNGRAATNGSGDRSVNFSQFPSELMNKLEVFKTQDASQVEGGVAGQINMETIKPLDYGKQRAQFEIKGNVNPDQLDQKDTEAGDLGYRFTASYTDQFEAGTGDMGFSIGVQRSDISQPEAESRQTGPTSNSRPACLITNGNPNYIEPETGGTVTGFSNQPETARRGDDDCDDVNLEGFNGDLTNFGRGSSVEGVDTSLVNGQPVDAGVPFVFAPSQRHFRQNDTRDQRDAIFGAFQWQPHDRLDINLDAQWSERLQSERRNDLTFNGGRRNDTSLNIGTGIDVTTLDTLEYTPSGAILYQITDSTIEVQGGDWQREENYLGGGLNVEYDVSDKLTVAADFGYSKTKRTEDAVEFRIQSNISPVIVFDRRNNNVPTYSLYDEEFDVNNHDNYVDRLRVRIDNDRLRENTIKAARFDVDYDLGTGFFTNLEAGVRWADQDYLELPGGVDSGDPFNITSGRFSFEIEDNTDLNINNRQVVDGSGSATTGLASNWVDIIASTNQACRTQFPEGNSFLSSQRNGNLVTNYTDDGTVLSSTNSWATFDATCMANTAVSSLNAILAEINLAIVDRGDVDGMLTAFNAGIPGLSEINSRTIDVQEVTTAFYAMTGYETTLSDLPLSGNIGVRLVQTEVDATGYRPELMITDTAGVLSGSFGNLQPVTASHSYTELLPSANAILELSENKLIRLGVFRALSRADPADMGYGRTISLEDDDDLEPATLDELIENISAAGNPELDPLTSWNFDAGFEWYPNPDSILAIGAYYKSFQGGFENVRQNETFVIDGQNFEFPVSVQQTNNDTSSLFGIEFTGSHSFSYLPGLLSGLGAKVSYNYVDSNFEFEDSRYGNAYTRQLDGSIIQTNQGIIAPGGLPGLSEHTFTAQAYYQIDDFDFGINYKYRDDYFQPFTSDGTRLRFIGDVGVWEARAAYKINDNFRLSAEAINLFSAPKEQYAFVRDDLYEVNDYGPRIFVGLRGRF